MEFVKAITLFIDNKRLIEVKDSSISTYSYTFNSIFLPYLPNETMDLDENHVLCIYEYLLKNLSRKTVVDKLNLLNDFLKFLFSKNYIDNIYSIPVPKKKKVKINIFNSNEQKILIDYLIKNMTHCNFSILLALKTGLRIGELSALQVKDIKSNCIKVTKTLQRIKNFNTKINKKTIIKIDTPKSESSIRNIPIVDPHLILLFNNLYKGLPSNSYLLSGSANFLEPRAIERRFENILKTCNINHKNFHILRHTFATNCIKNKMEIKALSSILGHSSVYTTYDLYIHLDYDTLVFEMEKMTI